MLDRRQFAIRLTTGAMLARTGAAFAQTGSRRQATMVVPYTPGGSTDVLGRLFAEAFSAQMGEKYILENRPGASGILGSSQVAAAPGDGRTLLYCYGNLLLNQEFMMKDAPLKVLEVLTPVTRTCIIQAVILAAPGFPANNLRELIALAKNNPGKYSYAYYGDLGIASMAAEADVSLLRVPYKGGVPGMVDVAAGTVDIITSSLAQALPLMRSGKLKVLAVYGDERLAEWPNVTTIKEVLPNYRSLDYQVVLAPKSTPADVIAQMAQRADAALANPEFKQSFLDRGAIVAPMQPKELRAFMETDRALIEKIVKVAGITPT